MMSDKRRSPRPIELLAPAKNIEVAIQAIDHGADAVYIGASSHGARQSAANSIDDIRRLTDYAHQFNAKIYTTVNTIVYEHELRHVERLVHQLYRANVDALIVQDMGLLRLDLPPIELHASTQCDNRTVGKAQFLEAVGFSQIVLARELTLDEIRDICHSVKVPIEVFIHGALCVSYSGRCHASMALRGRSANRGDCAQICRLPYTLRDADSKTICRDKHLLSLKDFNLTHRIADLMEAGVSSFKIEGRLKDVSYVKNVVSHYRGIIDNVIDSHPDLYRRASYGRSEVSFVPQPDKSFNRGFTGYFIDQRRPRLSIASIHTPKSLGEELSDTSMINNGDGISFFNEQGEYTGFRVNRVERGRIIPAQPVRIPRGATLYRTSDTQWDRQMSRPTAVRKIDIDIRIDETGVSATDEMGNHVRLPLNVTKEVAQKPLNVRNAFEKLGNTIYRLRNFESALDPKTFIPMSQLTDVRRELIEALTATAKTCYRHNLRRPEDRQAKFPADRLDYRDNVANSLSRQFYKEHGVKQIETAMEASDRPKPSTVVMTCRHCILRELKMCKRDNPHAIKRYREPLTITSGDIRLQLRFNCADCEMQVLTT